MHYPSLLFYSSAQIQVSSGIVILMSIYQLFLFVSSKYIWQVYHLALSDLTFLIYSLLHNIWLNLLFLFPHNAFLYHFFFRFFPVFLVCNHCDIRRKFLLSWQHSLLICFLGTTQLFFVYLDQPFVLVSTNLHFDNRLLHHLHTLLFSLECLSWAGDVYINYERNRP